MMQNTTDTKNLPESGWASGTKRIRPVLFLGSGLGKGLLLLVVHGSDLNGLTLGVFPHLSCSEALAIR
jgi:hypothetical protein